jgi:thiol-disulfide isomerase/thioredoxin
LKTAWAIASVGGALTALLAAGCAKRIDASPPRDASAIPLQLRLPLFPQGAIHDLVEDRGKVVLLDVWATWCQPCLISLPLYERMAKRYGARGFRVYAISIDEQTELIPLFLTETKLGLPILLDKGGAFAEGALQVQTMPTAVIVDRRGLVRYRHEGYVAEGPLQAEIEGLLAELQP